MAQHDFDIANQTFPATRADLNNALQAAATISAGASAPSTTYAYQLWFDTSSNTYKVRDGANSAWINFAGVDGSGNVSFDTSTLYIDSTNNRVGIGTTSPQNLLQIEGSSGTAPSQLRLGVTSGGQYYDIGRDYTDGLMTFYSGQAVPYTGYKFSVNAGSEKIRIDNDGLKFNGDTAAANALDDYEEGTFTPTVTPGSGSYTTTELDGRYTKIGRLVAFQIYFKITTVGTGSGSVTISGLPFTSISWYRMPNKWRENAATGICGQFTMNSGSASGFMQNDDGTNITHASGRVFIINGLYYSA